MPNAIELLALAFDKIEIRTSLSPPVTLNLRGPPDPRTEALLREVQPALIFTGNAGRQEFAPYGLPSEMSPMVKKWAWAIGAGVGGVLLGTFLFGEALGKRT